MAIYRLFDHLLTYRGVNLALQPAGRGRYRIGCLLPFDLVALRELPGGHRYAEGYKRTDPVIRWGVLYPSFLVYPLDMLFRKWCDGEGVGHRKVLSAIIDLDHRYGRLLADAITEDKGIAVDYGGNLYVAAAIGYRRVIVSGWRSNETVAAHLYVYSGCSLISLYTTEAPAADRPASLSDRFRESVGAARRLLRPFGLESDIIDRGTVEG